MGHVAPPLLPVERDRETVIMMTSVQETWCVAQTIVLPGTGIWTAARVSLKVVHFDLILGEILGKGNHQSSGDGSITVMSYNLYGWNALKKNSWKAANVYSAIRAVKPDILGAQEIDGM